MAIMTRVLITVLLLASAGSARAAFIYLPGSLQGADSDTAPLGVGSERVQLVAADSLLEGIPVGSLVTGLAFRVQPRSGATLIEQTVASYEIRLSRAANEPGALSTTFAENRGSDEVIVRSGALAIPAASAGNFVHIEFQEGYPFLGGPLLIEFAHDGFPAGGVLAQSRYGVAGVQSAFGDGFDAQTAQLGVFPDHVVVRLEFEPPPAPGVHRLRTVATNDFWHEDGEGGRLVSTRFQINDPFSRFLFEDRGGGFLGMRSEGSDGLLRVDVVGPQTDQLLSTRSGIDDDFASFMFVPEGDRIFRIFNGGDFEFLHEDGLGDRLLSTRFQETDDFTRFGVFRFVPERMLSTNREELADPGFLGNARDQAFSGNGQVLVFNSGAANVLGGDNNDLARLLAFDFTTGELTDLGVSTSGEMANLSVGPGFPSDDGRFVVFTSQADNLGEGPDAPTQFDFGDSDVFLRDRVAGTTTRISRETPFVGQGQARQARISGDGRIIAYSTSAMNAAERVDIFLYDREEDVYERITNAFGGGDPDGDSAALAGLSVDGDILVFRSSAGNLLPDDGNGRDDWFAFTRSSGSLERLDLPSQAKGGSADPDFFVTSISDDGRLLVVRTADPLVAADENGANDIYLYDRSSDTVALVSVALDGGSGGGASFGGRVSGDGRYVSFFSFASDIVSFDTNGSGDVFVRDLDAGETVLFSNRFNGDPSTGGSSFESLAGDASRLAFQSGATDLVDDDTNEQTDIFVTPVLYPPDAGLQPIIEFTTEQLILPEGDAVDLDYAVSLRRLGNQVPGAAIVIARDGVRFFEQPFQPYGVEATVRVVEPGVGNDTIDGIRRFTLSLVDPRNARVGPRSMMTVIITDDDRPEEVFDDSFEQRDPPDP